MLKRRFGVLEVISTLMLNFVALFGVSYLVRGPLQEPTRMYPETAGCSQKPPGCRRSFPASDCISGSLWRSRSRWPRGGSCARLRRGFRIRAVGAGAAAAASAGRVNVERVVFGAFLASGALAGLGGAVQVTGVTYKLFELHFARLRILGDRRRACSRG